jgi:protein JSN1
MSGSPAFSAAVTPPPGMMRPSPPPALDSLSSPPGLTRRPRAGTLPSSLHLDQARPDVLRRQLSGLPLLSPSSGAGTAGALSDDRFAAPGRDRVSAALRSSAAQEPNRLRSGSLTLPSSDMSSNAFGNGVFSGSWTPRGSGEQGRGNGSGNGATTTIPEELRSVPSNESSYSAEELVRTLDYLGLDDASSMMIGTGLPPLHTGSVSAASLSHSASHASLTSLRSEYDQHRLNVLASNASSGRLRANTVAAATRREPPLARRQSPLFRPDESIPSGIQEEDDDGQQRNSATAVSSDPTRLMYSSHLGHKQHHAHFSQANSSTSTTPDSSVHGGVPGNTGGPLRPRASTIGILDDSSQAFLRGRARAGTSLGIAPSLFPSSATPSLLTPQEQQQNPAGTNGHGHGTRFSSSTVMEEVRHISYVPRHERVNVLYLSGTQLAW